MLLFTCTDAAMTKDNVIIYHAVSLSVPFEKMKKIFESENSNIDIIRTYDGSAKMDGLMSEQNKHSDIMSSADFTVIDKDLSG
jgi:molybdate/tungstate transport system substrate-binding protein